MHAPAEFQFSVFRFGVWRGGLSVAGMVVWSSAFAWWIASERPMTSVAAAFLLLACLAATASLASLARVSAFVLRWDGGQWHLTWAAGEPSPGSLRVAIDGGRWLLVHFVPDRAAPVRASPRWLPVQRTGLESDWHRLRATLFTAHPAMPEAFRQDGRA